MYHKEKFAVISDVHGNYPALKTVMEDAYARGIDHFIFAGDYCLSGPWVNECIKTIKAVPEKYIIRGNEEKYLEDLEGKDQTLWTDGQYQISYWCYKNISRDNLDYLLNLPRKIDVDCNGIRIHISHHSTDFLGTYPFDTWNSVTVAERSAKKNQSPEAILSDMSKEREHDKTFLDAVSKLEKGVYIFGHSHVQCSYADEDKAIYLINPGSCGLPLDGIRDSAPYTVLEITDDGHVIIEEKRIPFDKAEYVSKVKNSAQYQEANVWSQVILREQTTALEHMYFFLAFVEQYACDIGDDKRPYSLKTWEKAFEIWDQQFLARNTNQEAKL